MYCNKYSRDSELSNLYSNVLCSNCSLADIQLHVCPTPRSITRWSNLCYFFAVRCRISLVSFRAFYKSVLAVYSDLLSNLDYLVTIPLYNDKARQRTIHRRKFGQVFAVAPKYVLSSGHHHTLTVCGQWMCYIGRLEDIGRF